MFKFDFDDNSTNQEYPKTLYIHNTKDGGVWQVYHVDNKNQPTTLIKGAKENGFMYVRLEDYEPCEETFPDWRIESARAYASMFPDLLTFNG